MKSVRLLFIMLSLIHLSSCKEQVPELRRLGASNESETQNFAFYQSQVSISSPEDALQFQGRCDARFKNLEVSFNQGQSWASFSQALGASGVENCVAQQFQININRAGDFFTFTSTPEGRTKELWLRGDLGFTKSMIIKSVIKSGDFTPPNPPPVFKTQSMFDTPTLFVSGNTEADFSHYECRVNQGSWFSCSNNTTITDNGNAIDRGVEAEISVVSVDTSGNRSEVTTTRFKNGIMANGVYGEINDVHVYDNGDILIAGDFETYEPEFTNTLARLHGATGVVDSSYIKPNITGTISSMVGDHLNGGLWINGNVTNYQGIALNALVPSSPRTFFINQEGEYQAGQIFAGTVHHLLENGNLLSTEGSLLTLRDSGDQSPFSTIVKTGRLFLQGNIQKVREDSDSLFILSGEEQTACLTKFDKTNLNSYQVLFCNNFANLGVTPIPYDGQPYPFVFGGIHENSTYNLNTQNPLMDFELSIDGNDIILAGTLNYFKDYLLSYPSCLLKIPKAPNLLPPAFNNYESFGSFISTISTNGTPITARCLTNIHKMVDKYILDSPLSQNKSVLIDSIGNKQSQLWTDPIRTTKSVHTLPDELTSLLTLDTTLAHYTHSSQEMKLYPDFISFVGAATQDNEYYYVRTSLKNFPTISKKSSHLLLLDDRGNIKKTFQNINGPVTKIIPQGDKVVLIGDFTLFENLARPKLIRLNADYTVDTAVPIVNAAFKGGFSDKNQGVYLFGDFTTVSFNGLNQNYAHLIKLSPNLTLNTNFRPVFKRLDDNDIIISDAIIDDSDDNENNWSIFITGNFTSVERSDQPPHTSFRLAKISSQDGSPNTGFTGKYNQESPTSIDYPRGISELGPNSIIIGAGQDSTYDVTQNEIYIIDKWDADLLDSKPGISDCQGGFYRASNLLACIRRRDISRKYYQISPVDQSLSEISAEPFVSVNGAKKHPKGTIYWFRSDFVHNGKFFNKIALLDDNLQLLDELFQDYR